MASPNSRPRKQNSRPTVNNLCPSMPKKETWERSGNFKLASPPVSCEPVPCASAETACMSHTPAASHLNIRIPPRMIGQRFFAASDAALPAASYSVLKFWSQSGPHIHRELAICRWDRRVSLPLQENGIEVWPRPQTMPVRPCAHKHRTRFYIMQQNQGSNPVYPLQMRCIHVLLTLGNGSCRAQWHRAQAPQRKQAAAVILRVRQRFGFVSLPRSSCGAAV